MIELGGKVGGSIFFFILWNGGEDDRFLLCLF